jgi:hypothetical protein
MATRKIELSEITKKSLRQKVDEKLEALSLRGEKVLMLLHSTGSNVGKYSFQNRSCIVIRTSSDEAGTGIMDYPIWI